MDLESTIRPMRLQVENELHSVFDRTIPAEYPELRQMLAYHLGWEGENAGPEAQGKRIRSVLVLLSAAASTTENNWLCAVPAAAAVELIHNFSLIHDDIQDQSPLRRGRPTLWANWGTAQAINAGDTMYTMAFVALSRLAMTTQPAIALRAHSILQQACLDLTRGQYLDLAYEKRVDLTLSDYWPMISGKTAALLSACTQLGSLAVDANEDTQEGFRRFGQSLGLAFQVLDDWLGLWGDSALTGKSAESDLVAGKKTFPILFGLAQKGEFARRWAAGPILPEQASLIASQLAHEGAMQFTQETADRLTQEALNALEAAGKNTQAADLLGKLSQNLLARKS